MTGAAREEDGGCEGGRPLALLSITPAYLCCSLDIFILTLGAASVVSQVRLFLHRTQQQTWPVPLDLLLLLTSVTKYLPGKAPALGRAVLGTLVISIWPWEISTI